MKRERGQSLLIVLALLGVGAVLIIPFLQMSSTALKSRQLYGQYIKEDFVADAAIEYGMWRLQYEPSFAASLPAGVESPPFYITLNGITANTTVLTQVVSNQPSGQPLARPAASEVYRVTKTVVASSTFATIATDGFESHTGSGGTGTWIGSWTLSGDYSFSTSSSYEGTYHLRLRGDDNSSPGDGRAQRRVNLSSFNGSGPYLNFWVKVESFESGDTAQARVSTDGTNWNVLTTFDYTDSDSQWHLYQYDLSSYGKPPDFYVGFTTSLSSSYDYLHIDALSFSTSQGATTIEPGVVTDFTYHVTIQCMDPAGGTALNNKDLSRIMDDLPNRLATSGDYLQYVTGSTQWDQADWGVAPFDPTVNQSSGSGSTLHRHLEWNFWDGGNYQDIPFAYGQVRTMSFKARAALTTGVYLNTIGTSIRHYSDPSDVVNAGQAKIVVDSPSNLRGHGAQLKITKTASPLVIYPNELTVVTYTIDIENVDDVPINIYEVQDWLPSTGSSDPAAGFVYVPNSAHGLITSANSSPDIFYDGFSRADSNTVSFWTDSDDSGSNVAINNKSVSMTTGKYYGNQFLVESTGSIGSMTSSTRKTALSFTAQSNQTVTKISVYLETEYGTSPTYRYGLQADSGGIPSGTWLGATNQGYGDLTATSTGWKTITLNQPVSLTAGSLYYIVVQYQSGTINTSNYIALRYSTPQNNLLPYNGTADPQSNTLFYSGGWTIQNYQPIYVLETATPTYEGNPYETTSDQSIYGTNRLGEKLTITGGTKLVSGIGFYVRKNNDYNDPAADLSYEIRDSANTVIRSGTLVSRTSINNYYQWWDATLSSSVNMTNGAIYTIDLYSAGSSSSYYYQVLRNANTNSAAYNATNYNATSSVYAFSTNGGSSWTSSGANSDPYDIPFRLTYVSEVSITQSNISTLGYSNIVFSYYYWRGSSGGTNPQLKVEWKPSSSGNWTTLATHTLTSSSPTQPSWTLPVQANNTNIDIRFTDLAISTIEARVDSVKVTSTYPISYTPVGMPDSNDGTDFFDKPDAIYGDWHSIENYIAYYRWELDWDFDHYPDDEDPVWDEGGLCEGYFWADYDPYLTLQSLGLQPGQIFRIIFQATVTLSYSGSYYDEVFVRTTTDTDAWLYSWPIGEVSVPQYDLQAQTLNSVLRANAVLTPTGHWWNSWHWSRHR